MNHFCLGPPQTVPTLRFPYPLFCLSRPLCKLLSLLSNPRLLLERNVVESILQSFHNISVFRTQIRTPTPNLAVGPASEERFVCNSVESQLFLCNYNLMDRLIAKLSKMIRGCFHELQTTTV